MKQALLACAVLLSACATPAPPDAEATPTQAALCSSGVALGKVVVAPLTRWRPDQKEPELRADIAMKAITGVMSQMPCATSVQILPVLPNAQSAARLADARQAGASTAILLRIDELGPIAILSFPALWSTWSDVKFTMDVVDVASGQTLRSIPHHRQKGGAFEVRGLDPLQAEMEQALKDVILGATPSR